MTTSRDIVLGSFIGDALALGPHWIYDPEEIRKTLGRVATYQPPLATYHAGKDAGDFTHYGDQSLVLLRSITRKGNFSLEDFAAEWRSFWDAPATISYRDGATRATLAALHAGTLPSAAASTSHDIGGAARIAPLFLLDWESDDQFFHAVREATAFTHGSPDIIEAAHFFAHVAVTVRNGSQIPAALEKAMRLDCWKQLPDAWYGKALESALSDSSDASALLDHGLSCNIADAFPGICHLLLRHPRDPAVALIENANAGGDSAARGMILGLVYGAAFPVAQWPAAWLAELKAREEIESLVRKLRG